MSIEVLAPKEVTHTENVIYDAHCYSCPKISEESGDYLPGPYEIAGIHKHLNLDQIKTACEEHEHWFGGEHEMVIRGIDAGYIQKLVCG